MHFPLKKYNFSTNTRLKNGTEKKAPQTKSKF
jgi:hypothetical protein